LPWRLRDKHLGRAFRQPPFRLTRRTIRHPLIAIVSLEIRRSYVARRPLPGMIT
jgi:hypothetical protein